MKILVCNVGSTSLKFKLFDMPSEHVLVQAGIERVGNPDGGLYKFKTETVDYKEERMVVKDYRAGIEIFLNMMLEYHVIGSMDEISAIGFKTVLSKGHLGVHVIDDAVLKGMDDYLVVAPAHNKHYLAAVRTIQEILPETTLVGVFETAFHQTIPEEAYVYSAPYEWYEKYGVRRFGYHGASHSYVAANLNERLGEHYRAVSCHLGGSCSLCAIVDGKSVDTSFGLSLQAGLPQSNRCGDIDPYLIFYMVNSCGKTLEEVEKELGTQSGLLGISGVSGDLRDVLEAADEGNERAKLAVDIFIHDLVKYIGGYAAVMGGIDAVAFTGGIGENSDYVRGRVIEKLAFLGIKLAYEPKKDETVTKLTDEASNVSVFVIPANEELGVARATLKAVSADQ